jgi:hypothetical protein
MRYIASPLSFLPNSKCVPLALKVVSESAVIGLFRVAPTLSVNPRSSSAGSRCTHRAGVALYDERGPQQMKAVSGSTCIHLRTV